jgi:hypothetical protein
MNPVHRIEPRLLTQPQFYGSPGEPTLGLLPRVQNPMMSGQAPSGGLLAPGIGALLAGLLYPGNAQGPNTGPLDPVNPLDVPNDEPVDIMPDSMNFKKAFAKARKMGLQIFTWRGKNYTTQYKEET